MRLFSLFLAIVLLLLNGCGSKQASYHFVQERLSHNELNFHHSLRVDEYINAFPQDWLRVEGENEIVMRTDFLTNKLPSVGENTLVQIAVKTRPALRSEMVERKAIAFVIDVSGSMNGEYIDDTKEAMVNAIQELNKGDIISIVTFDSQAEIIASNVEINAQNRPRLINDVKFIAAGGGTNIEAGLIAGYTEMAKFPEGISKRLLLLTDGQSTVASNSPEKMAQTAGVQYIEGARVSTIGLGTGVNEQLLRNIAEAGTGHYYFADTSKTLTKILRDDLLTTMLPVATGVKLDVVLGEGYELINIYGGENRENTSTRSLTLNLGELNVNDWRIIVMELKRISNTGDEISVGGLYQPHGEQILRTIPVDTQLFDQDQNINKYVLRNAVLFANASALVKASKLNSQKKFAEAIRILDLQLNNNQVLASIDNSEMLSKEMTTLQQARRIVADNAQIGVDDSQTVSSIEVAEPTQESSGLKGMVVGGLKIAADVLPGLWSTIAKVLVLAIE